MLLTALSPAIMVSAATSDFQTLMQAATNASLPLVNITVDTASIALGSYTSATVEIYDLAMLTDTANTYLKYNCEVKYRGETASTYDKKTFGMKLYDADGADLDVSLLGNRAENSWILDAMAIDRTRMRNRLCFDLWNDIDQLPYATDYSNRNGTAGCFVELFLNGTYHGLYCLSDKVDRKLLGLKKIKEGSDGSITIRGVLYKGSEWTDATHMTGYDATAATDGTEWNGWELQYPDDYPCADAWQPLIDVIDNVTSSSFADDFTSQFYLDNVADHALFMLATNYTTCPFNNTFLSIVNVNKSTQAVITPWDMDRSFGAGAKGTYDESYSEIEDLTDDEFYGTLYTDNVGGLQDAVIANWEGQSLTYYLPSNINARIDAYADAFTASGAWQREYEKWNGNPVALESDITTETDYVKNWYAGNYENVFVILGLKEASGISAVQDNQATTTKEYTIDGRALQNGEQYRGIVVSNGKKTIKQ